MRIHVLPAILVASILNPCRAARGQEPAERFGDQGQLVLAARTQVLLGTLATSRHAMAHDPGVSVGRTSETGSSSILSLSVGADYFLLDGFSLGGSLAYGHETDLDGIGGSVRAGYDFPLGGCCSIWGRGELSYARWERGNDAPGALHKVDVGASALVLFHPATHFFLGLGPMLVQGIYSHSSDAAATRADELVTVVGAQSVIGGWFQP
jgi:hypothetical protein